MKNFAASLRVAMWVGIALLVTLSAQAQSTKREITFSKIVVKDNLLNTFSGLTSVQFTTNLAFSWEEPMSGDRYFRVSVKMLQDGNVVFSSTDAKVDLSTANATPATFKGKKGMLVNQYEFSIPYLKIPLATGPQQVELVFSLANDAGTYTDCHREKVVFNHKKIERHDLNAQGFNFAPLTFDYRYKSFASSTPALQAKSKVQFRYTPEECVEDRYETYMVLRLPSGKVVFDSRNAKIGSDRTASTRIELVEGKGVGYWSLTADYRDIAMDGPGEADVVIVLLGTEGGPKEIHVQRVMLDIPPQYNFEEQKFKLNSVQAMSTRKSGVSGVQVNYDVTFGLQGTMRNAEKGSYYFYAILTDKAGQIVIAPERAPTLGANTTQLQDPQLPALDKATVQGSLFIPMHLLKLPAGAHDLKFALMVSDINLKTKFPVLGTGAVSIVKPAEMRLDVAVEQLELIPANYDSDIALVSSPNPELQYFVAVGEDNYYRSEYHQNSLSAIPGTAHLRLSEGDPVELVLYDVDSGFFNASDLQGRWALDYVGKGDSWVYAINATGQVSTLRVRMTRVK